MMMMNWKSDGVYLMELKRWLRLESSGPYCEAPPSPSGLPLGTLPLVEPIIDEAAEPEIVLEMVLRHSPNNDGQTTAIELHDLPLVCA